MKIAKLAMGSVPNTPTMAAGAPGVQGLNHWEELIQLKIQCIVA